jgi:sugar/nucleoside kinase (ribokinase family)
VVGFGLNAVDHLCRVPTFPVLDSKMLLGSYDCQPGGQVATAMVALSRWGSRAAYLGAFGDDPPGTRARQALEDAGVHTEGSLIRARTPNQMAVILIDERSGERTVLWHRDARLAVRPGEISRERFCAGRVLHLDGYDVDAALEAARWARATGIPTVIDLDTPGDGVDALLGSIDIAILPRACAAELTGRSDPEAALAALARYGSRLVGITLGREGVVALSDGRRLRLPAFDVRVVDTTGAGDVFHAGVIHGLLRGLDARGMLRFACAAAALQCTGAGAQPAVPDLAAIDALLETRA